MAYSESEARISAMEADGWRMMPGAVHPYRFAFEDWRFDRMGFPIP